MLSLKHTTDLHYSCGPSVYTLSHILILAISGRPYLFANSIRRPSEGGARCRNT